MARTRRVDVLVVGAGPVGLFGALALAERGLDVAVVDEGSRSSLHSYALALHAGTRERLARVGLAASAAELGRPVKRLVFHDGAAVVGELGLEAAPVLCLPQSELERVLTEKLQARGVRVGWNHRLGRLVTLDDGVEAHLEELEVVSGGYAIAGAVRSVAQEETVRASFVLGADGHASTVRRSMGVPFDVRGEADIYAVFEAASPAVEDDALHVMLHGGAPDAVWPLPGARHRWSFSVDDPGAVLDSRRSRTVVQLGARAFPHIAEGHLAELVLQRAPWFSGTPGEVYWSVLVRFERRLAARFGADRAFLAGDAAHLTGPVGSQSMNIGLAEADELAGAIADVVRGGAGRERLGGCAAALREGWTRLLPGPGRTPGVSQSAPEWVRRYASSIVPALPAHGESLSTLAGTLGIEL